MTRTTRFLLLPALLLAALASVCGLIACSGLASAAPDTAPGRVPSRPVIVEVEGDKANGFTLVYADGSSISPPTDSESMAECSEYDKVLDRVRCRVEVRTWYRDLGDLQRSLAWVRAHE